MRVLKVLPVSRECNASYYPSDSQPVERCHLFGTASAEKKNRFTIARLWIIPLSVVLIQCACTSKPSSRDRSEPDHKPAKTGPATSTPAVPSGTSPSTTQPASSGSQISGSKAGSDFDQIAREAEIEDAKKLRKALEPIVLPVGTTFYIHLENEVGSKISKSGDEFSGTLGAPVAVQGRVVIPAGTIVGGRVVKAKPAGRFKGGAILALELRSVVVNGKKVLMHTQMVTTESKGKGKRTAGMIAGGGGGGAVIGGLAGGGKGAAVGAAVGASAGATTAALTGKRDITLPAEALVAFRLSDPIELKQNVTEKAKP
ncbi:MAG: hypothetical protein ROO76_13055 [Terriglobia bacterium]|nr:hypothetical protein [Terriglobia bacterium]